MRNLLKYFNFLLGNEVAVDLGTATTLIYLKEKGIVLDEPSVVAVEKETGKVIAVGNEAKKMLGKTPSGVVAKRPMKDGVITDFALVQDMLHYFLTKVTKKSLFIHPKVLVCVPSGITEVEMRAVKDSAYQAGAREVFLVSEPIAAAVGIGLPISEPVGNMVIDIGGGTTEIAVIALNGIVSNVSVRVAGDEMDEAIVEYVKKKYKVLIGEQTAENVKMEIGTCANLGEDREMEIRGRDMVTGVPKTIKITSSEVQEALKDPISQIIEAVKKALDKTPPELASDIIDRGIYLTGGGALLKNLDLLLQEVTGLKLIVAEDPRTCVVRGAGIILENLDKFEKVLLKERKISFE
jgi:rod shape-determining protein MreB